MNLRRRLEHPNALVALVALAFTAAALGLAIADQWLALGALAVLYAVLLWLLRPQ